MEKLRTETEHAECVYTWVWHKLKASSGQYKQITRSGRNTAGTDKMRHRQIVGDAKKITWEKHKTGTQPRRKAAVLHDTHTQERVTKGVLKIAEKYQ
jgi:hypothetical protein